MKDIEPDFNVVAPKIVIEDHGTQHGYVSGFFCFALTFIKKLFTSTPCSCVNCVSSRLNTTDPFGYVPCVHSHPAIKLAHHRATMKTKNYIADVKKVNHE